MRNVVGMKSRQTELPAVSQFVAGNALRLLLLIVAFLATVPVYAGQVACTPTAGFTNCVNITYSGADQTLTLPANVLSVQARVWGAAGGGTDSTRGYLLQGGGAGGGYATGTIAVTSGQTLTVVVGQGGVFGSTTNTYGGGGGGGSSTVANINGGSGGGNSAVFSSATKTAANALLVAGGGGGASPGADGGTVGAGGGGATTGGQDALPALSGRGGSQIAGGAAATGTSACTTAPTAGAQFQGGKGAASSGSNPNEGGGGGGGGYFGGGGGLCQSAATQNGGGGGGSSFIAGTGVTSASTLAGANFLYSGASCAGTAASGGAADSLYAAGIGQGSCYGTGGNGQVIIQWTSATMTLAKISNGGVGGFTFTGTNGWASQTITTVTSGTGVAGAKQVLTSPSTATTITETIPPGYALASVSCSGLGAGGTATPNLSTGAVAFNAAATAAGSNIACTFTNTKLIPAMTVVKSANTAGPVSAGTVITYTFKVKNTGNTTITSVTLADTFNGNGTPPAPANEVLSLDAAPSGDSSNGTPNDGNWAVLGPGDEATFTAAYTVTQADIDLLQ